MSLNDYVVKYGAVAVRGLENWITKASLIPTDPFLDPAQFGWTDTLERNWKTIREELERVMVRQNELPNFQDISPDQKHLSGDDKWKTFFLFGYGFKAEANCRRCPRTTALLESIPGMKTAFFSILAPGKHIPPHRGPFKGVIRCHLGLIVPEPRTQCRIRVGQEIRHWEEGRVMVFDDSYNHEVWNDTSGVRVVLFLDIVRPLRFPVSALNGLILKLIGWSPFVQDAAANYRRWEREFDRPEAVPAD